MTTIPLQALQWIFESFSYARKDYLTWIIHGEARRCTYEETCDYYRAIYLYCHDCRSNLLRHIPIPMPTQLTLRALSAGNPARTRIVDGFITLAMESTDIRWNPDRDLTVALMHEWEAVVEEVAMQLHEQYTLNIQARLDEQIEITRRFNTAASDLQAALGTSGNQRAYRLEFIPPFGVSINSGLLS
jgi:hypothetical protein